MSATRYVIFFAYRHQMRSWDLPKNTRGAIRVHGLDHPSNHHWSFIGSVKKDKSCSFLLVLHVYSTCDRDRIIFAIVLPLTATAGLIV